MKIKVWLAVLALVAVGRVGAQNHCGEYFFGNSVPMHAGFELYLYQSLGFLDDCSWGVASNLRTRSGYPINRATVAFTSNEHSPALLAKVTNGVSTNGHWWLDFGLVSGLTSKVEVRNEFGYETLWVFLVGKRRHINVTGGDPEEVIVCGYPLSRLEYHQSCAVVASGKSISLRDAWLPGGDIPDDYIYNAAPNGLVAPFERPKIDVEEARALAADRESALREKLDR